MTEASAPTANLILAHGLFGYREELGVDYFNGIADRLVRDLPVAVVATQVDPTRSVSYRAGQLQRQVLIAWGEVEPHTHEEHQIANKIDPANPTHIIAHSMGALDVRQLVSPAYELSLGDRITSLTTVGGINHGSPSADLAWSKIQGGRHNLLERFIAKRLTRALAAVGLSFAGIHDLTTESTTRFNETFVDHPNIRYRSIAGKGRNGRRKTGLPILLSWRYVKHKTGQENDGFVTPALATWGELDRDFWPADHLEEVGHDLNRFGAAPKNFDYLPRWTKLARSIIDTSAT